ncbi:MAG: calcium-translocating P-type ATPase, SERCA-type [Candidatus Altiarchaeota archaeon]|nr:calcium-translocating P-type ATPase, SERCA-type [Candidatus Altiarchaeota archaeon]
MENFAWHSQKADEVFRKLESSDKGLSGKEGSERLERFGPNQLVESKGETPLQMFLDQFKNFLVVILIFAAAISASLGFLQGSEDEMIEAVAIIVVILFITVVGFIQEYRADKAMQALKGMVSLDAGVLRDGRFVRIPAKKLVPGDVLVLEAGDRIPVDARLFEVIDFRVDEAALTGESVPAGKDVVILAAETDLADRRNMVYMGTHATYGKAKAVVVGTGMGTELGRIAETIQSMEREKTPLQMRLDRVGKQVGIIVLVLCAIVFAAGVMTEEEITFDVIVYMGIAAIALAVAAVPEGLPGVVTVTLAKGMREMAKKNAIVKKLNAVETLGSTTVICSDKTGTLTRNEMTVRKILVAGNVLAVSGEGYKPAGEFTLDGEAYDRANPDLQLLLRASTLCNNASLENVSDGKWKITGDPTEAALVVAASKADLWQGGLHKEYPRIAEIPFSSERKMMSTVHKEPGGGRVAYVKGAPDVIINLCGSFVVDGRIKKLSGADRERILSVNDEFASNALRVLGVAFRTLGEGEKLNSNLERDLVYAGLLGMIDPPREDATQAVKVASEAGIKSVMITGDHKLTAVAVGKEMGLYHEGDLVLTGAELEEVSEEDFRDIVEKVVIYARVSPEHKLRIVDALKKNGHIVAMTGDGVNDAPALKRSDIGVSMGITGTDVAKEASDMVLVDDNFASIVAAVKEGRGIYSNIKLFIKYLLSCNIGEVLTIFVGLMVFSRLPLTPLQILWMNFLTDAAPALALAWNPPDPDVMQRKPRDPKENIINKSTVARFFAVGALMASGTLILFWMNLGSAGDKAVTIAFTTIIMFQMFYALSCRSDKFPLFRVGLFSNRYLVLAIILSLSLQFLVIYFPPLQNIFKTVPLDVSDWLMILGVSSTAFIVPELWKLRTIRK